jgi:hypothetical protein
MAGPGPDKTGFGEKRDGGPGPARHDIVTELGVQGDRARLGKTGPGKTGIRMNKELDWK